MTRDPGELVGLGSLQGQFGIFRSEFINGQEDLSGGEGLFPFSTV